MSMRPRTADALVGLLVVSTILIVTVALVVTKGWTERRIVIYMLSPSVKDLKADTPVFLQGLSIGEVKSISPLVDSSGMGPPEFLVALRLRERYANGVPIRLPLGTRAEIASTGLIGSASIALLVPPNDIQAALVPGDTIRGQLTQGWTDVLKEVADTLRVQVSDILKDTRRLLATLDRTATSAQAELNSTAPELRATLASARQVLDRLEPMITQAQSTLATTDQRVGVLHDSLVTLMGDTRRLINSADTLTTTMTGVTNDLAPDIRRTINNMYLVSAKLDHFMNEVSRRPHRLLTGVHPPPPDSVLLERRQ